MVCCLSLIGIPFMAGFYSKDLIVEGIMRGEVSLFSEVVILLTIILTSFYSGRLMLILFSSFSFLRLEGVLLIEKFYFY